MKYSYLLILAILIAGCSSNNLFRKAPKTIEEAKAMAMVETARIEAGIEGKIRTINNGFKLACLGSAILSIGAIIAGQMFNIKLAKMLGFVSLLACIGGYFLIQADIHYGKWLALISSLVVILLLLYLFVSHRTALKQIVKANELIKLQMPPAQRVTFGNTQRNFQVKDSVTEKMVDKIRGV